MIWNKLSSAALGLLEAGGVAVGAPVAAFEVPEAGALPGCIPPDWAPAGAGVVGAGVV